MSSYYSSQQQYQQIPQIEMQQYNGNHNQHSNYGNYNYGNNNYGSNHNYKNNNYGSNSNHNYGNNNHENSNHNYENNNHNEYYGHYASKYDKVDTKKMSHSQYATHVAKRESSRAFNAFRAQPNWVKIILGIIIVLAIIGVIVGIVFAGIALVKQCKKLLDEATANGLNPIQWMVDPFGSMLNLMGYMWQSFITLITGGWIK